MNGEVILLQTLDFPLVKVSELLNYCSELNACCCIFKITNNTSSKQNPQKLGFRLFSS